MARKGAKHARRLMALTGIREYARALHVLFAAAHTRKDAKKMRAFVRWVEGLPPWPRRKFGLRHGALRRSEWKEEPSAARP